MNQRLPPASNRSRHVIPSTSSRWASIIPRRFTLQVRLRGETGPTCEVRCAGLEEAIRFAEVNFPAFTERNPWLALDSRQHQIWILLDPEIESTSGRW